MNRILADMLAGACFGALIVVLGLWLVVLSPPDPQPGVIVEAGR